MNELIISFVCRISALILLISLCANAKLTPLFELVYVFDNLLTILILLTIPHRRKESARFTLYLCSVLKGGFYSVISCLELIQLFTKEQVQFLYSLTLPNLFTLIQVGICQLASLIGLICLALDIESLGPKRNCSFSV